MDALRGYDPEFDSTGEYAIKVYRAMSRAAERRVRTRYSKSGAELIEMSDGSVTLNLSGVTKG